MKRKITVLLLVLLIIFGIGTECLANAAETAVKSPLYGEMLRDGEYEISVTSSSSMFKVLGGKLTVSGGKMNCVITLNGTGYGKLYMGSAEDAQSAAEADFIPFAADAEGKYTYNLPLTMLDAEVATAAYSTKKETWYDRTLVFESTNIPEDAIVRTIPEDGEYTIDVTLTGGSGRASITSPAKLTVVSGVPKATLQWSSSTIDYMKLAGVQYDPIQTEGNSTFEIPVVLDVEMPIVAQTSAMSTPHEVEYTLRLSSQSMSPVKAEKSKLTLWVGIAAAIVVILAAVLLNRKRAAAK